MIGSLMLYGTIVGSLFAAAAALAEHTLRLVGKPARMVWMAALIATLGSTAWTLRRPARPELDSAGPLAVSPAVESAAASNHLPSLRLPGISARLDRPLLALWLVLSVSGFTVLLIGIARLRRERRRWTKTVVDGREVLVSETLGPLVAGLLRPRVVLPRWALELAAADRRLILAHEEEHRSARDPLLLAIAALTVAVAPWNPAIWWQRRRLRVAMELDCDRRVLRWGAEPIAYGGLLLRIGSRRSNGPNVFAAALGEPNRSILERRLRMITTERVHGWMARSAVTAAAAALLVTAACEVPTPTPPDAAKAIAQSTGLPRNGPAVAKDDPQPLLLVDGVPSDWVGQPTTSEGMLVTLRSRELSPNDIARIEVYKGSAAAELYGEGGKHDVIRIMTKAAEQRRKERTARGEGQPDAKTINLALGDPATAVLIDGRPVDGSVVHIQDIDVARVEVKTGSAASAERPGSRRVVLITTTK